MLRAPAGYGKTTVLRQMLPHWRAAGARVLWMGDGDLFAPFAQRWRTPTRTPDPDVPAILVCDDMQTRDEAEWDDALATILRTLLPHQHVVLAVRKEPPPAVWEACQQLDAIVVGSEQLRFSVEECGALLFSRHTSEAIALSERLHRLTGGWPAAVASAGVSIEDDGFPDALVPRNDGPSHGTSAGGWETYVREQVLNKQPALIRSFLFATALLGQISVELCDVVLGHPGSQAMIEGLVDQELLRPLENDRGWFDHHPLVAETLRSLSYRDDPVRSQILHREAARWHLQRNDRRRALAQYLAVGDHLSAADVVLGSASHEVPLPEPSPLKRRAAEVKPPLSKRETQVLELVASGHGNKEISRRLFVSVATVKAHVYNIFRKLPAASRTAAVAEARRRGLLS